MWSVGGLNPKPIFHGLRIKSYGPGIGQTTGVGGSHGQLEVQRLFLARGEGLTAGSAKEVFAPDAGNSSRGVQWCRISGHISTSASFSWYICEVLAVFKAGRRVV